MKRLLILLLLGLCLPGTSQTFRLETVNDSLSWLVLQTDSTKDRWELPYPVYQFQVGDVNGNGLCEAMVGVVKKTRFHREEGRRIFIFKNYRGKVRPLWMGSRLGGQLIDFRFLERPSGGGIIRALETGTDNHLFTVTDYHWEEFGMSFKRFIKKNINHQDNAYEIFLDNSTDPAD